MTLILARAAEDGIVVLQDVRTLRATTRGDAVAEGALKTYPVWDGEAVVLFSGDAEAGHELSLRLAMGVGDAHIPPGDMSAAGELLGELARTYFDAGNPPGEWDPELATDFMLVGYERAHGIPVMPMIKVLRYDSRFAVGYNPTSTNHLGIPWTILPLVDSLFESHDFTVEETKRVFAFLAKYVARDLAAVSSDFATGVIRPNENFAWSGNAEDERLAKLGEKANAFMRGAILATLEIRWPHKK